jgi:hypothetical protein
MTEFLEEVASRGGCGRRRPVRLGFLVALALLAGGSPRAADQTGLPAPLPPGQASGDSVAPEEPGLRPALDLLANRVHAVVHRQGRLVVSAADPSFAKFVDGGWKTMWFLGERDGGKRVALVNGLSALLFVPVDTDGDGPGGQALGDVQLRLTLRSRAPRQKVSVLVNEKAVGTYDLPMTTTVHDLTVPGAVLIKGENRIRLTFRATAALGSNKRRSAAVLEQLELGPTIAQPLDARPPVGQVELGGGGRRADDIFIL